MSVYVVYQNQRYPCASAGQLASTLRSRFTGRYVTVFTLQRNGEERMHFINVELNGDAVYTYSGKPFEPESIRFFGQAA